MIYRKLLFLALWCSAGLLHAQLPKAWQGSWAGQLEIYPALSDAKEVRMSLDIKLLDSLSCTFVLGYGEPAKPMNYRNYTIRRIKGNTYVIDEADGILLDTYLIGNKLISKFEVIGSWLLCSYELRGDSITYEVYTGKATEVRSSGGTKKDEEEIPLVKSFAANNWQRATLLKQLKK